MAGERDKRFAEKASHMQERVNLNADINTKIRTLRKDNKRLRDALEKLDPCPICGWNAKRELEASE